MNTVSVLAAIAVTLSLCLADDSIVKTDTGDVQGVVFQTHRAFLGIPFVEPPVGSLRWAPPVVAKSWAPSTLDATKFKPGCPQHCHLPPGACPPSLSEDCMYLNVYTPRKPVSNKLPIIVWFPGGHFEQGSAGSILYDGAYLVTNQSQVILIAINYRLGALGWLTNNKIPELADGNFGLQDQIEGLKWVQRNAAAFGGDPNQVTVAGQSAGATSSAALLVSPAAKGLFAKIILQSNPISLPFRYRDDASTLGQEVGKILKCDNIDCMRSKSADAIVDAQHEAADKILLLEPLVSFLPWAPTVDEKLVPMRFLDAIQKNQYNKDAQGNPLPMMMGTVAEEAVIFVYMVSKKPFNDAEYIGAVALAFGTSAFRVLSHYPPTPFVGDKRPAISVLVTDYLFGCVNRYAAGILQSQGNKNLFLYRFNHSLSFDAWGPMYPFCEGKVCHGAELPILFHQSGNATLNANENRLFNDMAAYWTNFAWTGNPNNKPSFGGRNVPTWPAFTPSVPQHMELWTERSFVIKEFNKVNCDMFDSVGYWHGAGGK